MHTLVQIICSKYVTELQHYWTNKLHQVWLAFNHCWVLADKVHCEQIQIVFVKNH